MKRLLSICSVGLAVAMLGGCNGGEPDRTAPLETVAARVVVSRQEQVPVTVRATGTLRARETATLSAQVMGRIERVLVREGDAVRAGQTLVILDDATLRAGAEQAEAAVKAVEGQQAAAETNAALAASTLARYKQLQTQKSVSPQEMDEVSRRAEAAAQQAEALRAQGDAAKAEENSARAMLGFTRISAPFAGVVTARMADPGTLAAPGVPLLQIDSAGPLQLQASVDESAIGAVHKGMKMRVDVDGALARDRFGTVAEMEPAADAASRSFVVKIDLAPASELRAGMYATAEIATGSHEAIVAPRSAVVLRGSLPCAYVIDNNGVAQLRYVTLGAPAGDATQGNLVEVLSGISAGERLVDDPGDRDLAGKRIEVQP